MTQQFNLRGQDSFNYSNKNDIRLSVLRKFKGQQEFPIHNLDFDKFGKIKQISGNQIGFMHKEGKKINHFLRYYYLNDGRLNKEVIYESINNELVFKRLTKYDYNSNCISVIVYSNKENEIIGQIEKCSNDSTTSQNFKLDKVISDKITSDYHPKYVWAFNKDSLLTSLEISSKNNRQTYELKYESNLITISRKLEYKDKTNAYHLDKLNKQYRFFDKKEKLNLIGSDKNKKNWYVKFHYNKLGLIDKITERGKNKKSDKWTIATTSVKSKISKKLMHELKLNNATIKKINKELINMWYPIHHPKGNSINYLDSRRFLGF